MSDDARRIVSFLTVLIIIVGIFIGCDNSEVVTVAEANDDRFIVVDSEQVGIHFVTVFVDTKTNVMYLVTYNPNYGTGVTVLVNHDGDPLLWMGE